MAAIFIDSHFRVAPIQFYLPHKTANPCQCSCFQHKVRTFFTQPPNYGWIPPTQIITISPSILQQCQLRQREIQFKNCHKIQPDVHKTTWLPRRVLVAFQSCTCSAILYLNMHVLVTDPSCNLANATKE